MSGEVSALRHNWRKVSSTDNLQAFSAEGGQGGHVAQGTPGSRTVGLCMLLLSAILVLAQLLALVAKLVGKPQWRLVLAMKADSYYIYLVPLMVPMAVVGVTLNWFSLKLFKHNS